MTTTQPASSSHPTSALPALVAFDLDDTLAPSKTAIPAPMAAALRDLLDQVPVCIISGGQIGQFRDQVLAHLDATPRELARLHLMPTCGTRYYTYVHTAQQPCQGRGEQQDQPEAAALARAGREDLAQPAGRTQRYAGVQASDLPGWDLVYAQDLTAQEAGAAMAAVEQEARRLGLWEEETWGPVLENRGSQITFSALGQQAPIEAKRAWDPTGEKKTRLRDAVAPLLPQLEVRSGGSTSVDITRKGVDKAYGMRKLAEVTGIGLGEMLFVGDRLDPAGNDYPVKALGVPCHAVTGWEDTAVYVADLAARLAGTVQDA